MEFVRLATITLLRLTATIYIIGVAHSSCLQLKFLLNLTNTDKKGRNLKQERHKVSEPLRSALKAPLTSVNHFKNVRNEFFEPRVRFHLVPAAYNHSDM